MNNRAWLAAAVLLLPGSARAANIGALEARSAEMESGAQRMFSELERSLKALSDGKPFGIRADDDWVAPERSRDYCAQNLWPLDAVKSPARIYYMCKAVAAVDPAVCYEMGPNSRVSIFFKHSDCVRGYWNLRLSHALISKSKDLEEICRNHEDFKVEFTENDRRVICGSLRNGSPTSLCELLQRDYPDQFRHPDLKDCVTDNNAFWGVNDDCEAFGSTGYEFMEEQLCIASSRYRKARAASDPRLCKNSSLCRALMGDTKACDESMTALRADACKAEGSPRRSSTSSARAQRIGAEIDGALTATLRRPMTPAEIEAARRLHEVMTGSQPVDPSVVADVVLLRMGGLGDLVTRGETICTAISDESSSCRSRLERLRKLQARSEKAVADFGRETGLSLDVKAYRELFAQ
ncbi:MAG: hypothetical protein HY923_04530 [Elusimicrobia bacterium]|nr:hypothetical protein [Elusimicrobiota bacterium]